MTRLAPESPAGMRAPRALRHLCALAVALIAAMALAAPAFALVPGEFQTLAESSNPLTSVAVDTATNVIYAQQNRGKAFYSYDPRTNEWKELAEAPVESGNNGGAAYVNGKVYVAYTHESTSVFAYDIAKNEWTELPNPLKAGTTDIMALGEDLYMAAGNEFIKYDTATETTTPLAAVPNFAHGGSENCEEDGFTAWGGLQAYNGKIYGHQGDDCNGMAVYDIAENKWSELPAVPAEEDEGPVAGSALDPASGTYYAYGTYGGKTLWAFDIASETWSSLTTPFTEIDDGGMAYVTLAGRTGVYMIEGEEGDAFMRFVVKEAADLSVTQSASGSSAKVGEELTYSFQVANAGPDEAGGVSVSDPLPAGVSLVSAVATQGVCSGTTTVTCALGALVPSGTATVTIKVRATGAGSATNTATVSSETPDPNAANNSAATVVVVAAAVAPKCESTRTEVIHWKTWPAVHLESVTVTVNGKLFKRLKGSAHSVSLSLKGRSGQVVVAITGKTAAGKRYGMERVYHPCVAGTGPKGPKSLYLKNHKT